MKPAVLREAVVFIAVGAVEEFTNPTAPPGYPRNSRMNQEHEVLWFDNTSDQYAKKN